MRPAVFYIDSGISLLSLAYSQFHALGADFFAQGFDEGVKFRLAKVAVFSVPHGHKILILCSGIMVHFISSNLVTQHLLQDKFVHLKEMLTFVIFIGICTTPLWLFPRQLLQILFFAVQWTGESLDCSSQILRILSMSLLFQAARLSMISTLLKNKETYTYAFIVSVAGAANIIACLIAGINLPNNYIPVFALTGDILITVILLGYYIHRKALKW